MGTGKPPRLWGGRFAGETAETVRRLNDSLAFDARLWRQDIAGSVAHATMLGETGVIPAQDAAAIVDGLRAIAADLERGDVQLDPAAEDVHTAVEALLRERIGAVAGKLHTARSRNDQVATDTRLWLRDAIDRVRGLLGDLQTALAEAAERELDTMLPGLTHLQHAQPVLLAHHLLAYVWMLQRDRERLADARRRVNMLPLGAGALAGTSFPIDRARVAALLGFDGVLPNSIDAVADRDFAIEFLADAAIVMVHLSRLAEELILWSCPEFGFVTLDDSVTTGSSIMPQKKNPDVAELARGKTGRVIGDLTALLTVMKGLPLAYNKDMQEDKVPLFDAVDTLEAVLPALRLTIETAAFDRERMASACRGDFSTATDLADHLVCLGMPFREAHGIVGRVVRGCIERGVGLEDLSLSDLRAFAPGLDEGALGVLSVEASVFARRHRGGTARAAVVEQLAEAREAIAGA